MFSLNSWSPVEIHILWPLSRKRGPKGSCKWSAPSGVARVATSDNDDPACGSLRHMVPVNRPLNSFRANTSFCKALPCFMSKFALPTVSMPPPMLTEAHAKKALAAASTVNGNCMPPMSWLCDALNMPLSTYAWCASRVDSGKTTRNPPWPSGSVRGSWVSTSRLKGANLSRAMRSQVSRTASNVSRLWSANRGRCVKS